MEIEINTDALRNDSNNMEEQIKHVYNDMQSLNDAVAQLNSMWRGDANIAFNTVYRSDYENMQEACKAVDQLISCMRYAVKQYNECDSKVMTAIRTVKI